jgi:hypothetical protein
MGNVLLLAGRCLLFVGDVVHGASTRAQAIRAPIAAAKPLYKGVTDACA